MSPKSACDIIIIFCAALEVDLHVASRSCNLGSEALAANTFSVGQYCSAVGGKAPSNQHDPLGAEQCLWRGSCLWLGLSRDMPSLPNNCGCNDIRWCTDFSSARSSDLRTLLHALYGSKTPRKLTKAIALQLATLAIASPHISSFPI